MASAAIPTPPRGGGTSRASASRLRNAAGDVLAFSPWTWAYEPTNDNNCAKVSSYEPTTWTWPQGVSLTFTYGTQSGGVTIDYQPGVTAIASSLGRTMNFTAGPGVLLTAATNGVTVGQQSTSSISDAVSVPSGGNTGRLLQLRPTSAILTLAASEPAWCPINSFPRCSDPVQRHPAGAAVTATTPGASSIPPTTPTACNSTVNAGLPSYQRYPALGGRGERDDPHGGAYTVPVRHADGDAVRNIDEIGRETDSAYSGRPPPGALPHLPGETTRISSADDINDNVLLPGPVRQVRLEPLQHRGHCDL